MSKADGPASQRASSKRDEDWRKQNAEAIAAYNRYVELNGLMLTKYRRF